MVSFRHSDIFRHMDRLRAEIEGLASVGAWFGSQEPGTDDLWAPPVDIQETDESLLLTVDLPGVARESIGLEVDEEYFLMACKAIPALAAYAPKEPNGHGAKR